MKVLLATRLIWRCGVGHTGEEVHQTAGNFLVGGFQIQHDGALVVQVVCNRAGILEVLRLDQNDLELGGRMDVDHLAVPLGGCALFGLVLFLVACDAETVVVIHHLRTVVHVLIVVIVLTAESPFFRLSTKDIETCSFHSGSSRCLAPLCEKELLIAFSII